MTKLDFIIFLSGLALFGAGVYLIYPPASLIAVGAVLMYITLFGGKNEPSV